MKRGIAVFVFLLLGISFISAATMHYASNVPVVIDGVQRELAASAPDLKGNHIYNNPPSLLMGQHDPSQIWVSVQDGEMTLLEALSSAPNKLCPNPSQPLTYSSTDIPNPSHLATEILMNYGGWTLQESINFGFYCGCIPGNTRYDDCDSLDNICIDYNDVLATCSSAGTWNSPSCNSYTSVPIGTACTSDNWHSCNGVGSCLGWSGTGCSSCPYGYTRTGTLNVCYLCPNQDFYCNSASPLQAMSSRDTASWNAGRYCNSGLPYQGYMRCSQIACGTTSGTQYSWRIKP